MRKGDVATICSTNSLEYFTVYLALSSIGAIPSPVNPAYQYEDLQRTVEVSNSKLIIVKSQLAEMAKKVKYDNLKGVVTTDKPVDGCISYEQLLSGGNLNFEPRCDFDPENDMLVLPFSSGTTGLPKGVMLTHYNVCSNIKQTL